MQIQRTLTYFIIEIVCAASHKFDWFGFYQTQTYIVDPEQNGASKQSKLTLFCER